MKEIVFRPNNIECSYSSRKWPATLLVFDINGCLVGLLLRHYVLIIGWYKMIVYLHSSPSFANFSEGPTLSPKPSYSSSHFPGTSFAFFTTRYTTAGFFDTTLFIIIIIFLVRVLIWCITFFQVQKFLDFDLIITVAGRGKISEPSTAGTSKLDWRCFEYYQIDRKNSKVCYSLLKIKNK